MNCPPAVDDFARPLVSVIFASQNFLWKNPLLLQRSLQALVLLEQGKSPFPNPHEITGAICLDPLESLALVLAEGKCG